MKRQECWLCSRLLGLVLSLCFVVGLCLPLTVLGSELDGGQPEDKGRQKDDGETGVKWGDLFGDQWVVIRDLSAVDEADGDAAGNGEPILFSWTWPAELYKEGDLVITVGDLPEGFTTDQGECVQPFSFEPISAGEQFVYSSYVDSYGKLQQVYLVPLDDECKIPDAYAETWGEEVMEVESGRLNIARSSQDVFDAAYEEVLSTANKASSFSLDPAGRLVMLDLYDAGLLVAEKKTIDSPLENLALYQRMLLYGCLSATENIALSQQAESALVQAGLGELVCGEELTVTNSDLLQAASFLAGGGDKTGNIGVDLIVYLNNALNINPIDIVPKQGGSVNVVDYYNFGEYRYARDNADLSNVASLLQAPSGEDFPGGFPLFDSAGYPTLFVVEEVKILPTVFGASWNLGGEYDAYPIVNFARAADDAQSIIFYIHNFARPDYPVEPVP